MEAFQTHIRTNNSLYNSCCWTGNCGASDIFSDKYSVIIKEVDKIITGESCRDAGFDRMMALSQPGYSAEKDPRFILVFFYQRWIVVFSCSVLLISVFLRIYQENKHDTFPANILKIQYGRLSKTNAALFMLTHVSASNHTAASVLVWDRKCNF